MGEVGGRAVWVLEQVFLNICIHLSRVCLQLEDLPYNFNPNKDNPTWLKCDFQCYINWFTRWVEVGWHPVRPGAAGSSGARGGVRGQARGAPAPCVAC